MIKLLHVLPTLKSAGAESLVVNIIKNLDSRKIQTELCVLYPPRRTILENELQRIGVRVYHLGKKKGFDVRIFGRFYALLKHLNPDIVHTHSYVMRYTMLPTIMRRVRGRIHTVHNIASKEVEFFGRIVHWVAFRIFGYIPVGISKAVSKSVEDLYNIPCSTIYNGIPLDRFLAVRRKKNGKRNVVFINVSWFRPQKDHRLLVEAFAEAVKLASGIRLLLVGDGPLRAEIEKRVKEKKLYDKILFLGLRDDVDLLFAKSDIYISSSKWEGFGLTIVEAMAAGKAVIATAVDGVPELVQDNICGILVPHGSVGGLASAIVRLANRPQLREKMGRKGRTRAAKMFAVSDTSRAYEKIYMSLVDY
jgi:glycosyltransferase involved in cell wall biosynthesis